MQHGSRPSHKIYKPSQAGGSSGAGGQKHCLTTEQIPSSSGITTERDTTSEDESTKASDLDRHEGIIGGKELALLRYAEQSMYIRTLFVDPFPGVLKLNPWVLDVWRKGEKELAKVDQSTKSRALVSGSYNLSNGISNLLKATQIPLPNSVSLRLGSEKNYSLSF